MQQWLGTFVFGLALFLAPIEAATKEAVEHTKYKTAGKHIQKKKAEATKKHSKLSKQKKQEPKRRSEKSPKKAKTHEASKSKPRKSAPKEKDEIVGKTAEGRPVYEGSKRGHYYLDASGNREYVQTFDGANIVGRTADGRNIYQGPRGGHFYYTASGNKEYVKKW